MKSCPVCHARCFDDMETCFGCLHDFCADDPSAVEFGLLATGYLEEPQLSVPPAGIALPASAAPAAGPAPPAAPAPAAGPAPAHGTEDVLPVPETPKRPFALQFGMNSQERERAGEDAAEDTAEIAAADSAADSAGDSGEEGAEDAAREAGRKADMLLAVDVGNTHTVMGLFEGDALRKTWRVSTAKDRTADEVAAQLSALLHMAGYRMEDVSGAVFASVVPRLTDEWRRALAAFSDTEPVACVARNAGDLFVANYPNPDEIGQDRIADAIALKALYGAPAIVVDFGTATNIEIIDEQGRFCGGIIAPGVETSMAALFGNASKLAMVDLEAPESAVGKNTVQAIQSGIVFGEAARVDGLLQRVYDELGYRPAVVATGGLATLVAAHSAEIQTVDRDLTLHGLRILYEHRCGPGAKGAACA